MRVLQLSWEYPPVVVGGLGRHVGRLSRALAADGIAVEVVTRASDAHPAAATVEDGVRVHRVGAPPHPYEIPAFLRWVASLNAAIAARAAGVVGDERVDLVHSHDWLVAGAARAIAARAGAPWLVTVHATEHGRHRGRIADPPQSTIHAAEAEMIAGADGLLVCSEWMREHVAEVFDVPHARIAVVGNGIDVGTEAPRPASGSSVLLAGRLVWEKGFDVALRALAPLAADGVRIDVAGAGPMASELRALATELGIPDACVWHGWVDDDALTALYEAAAVCVVPSRYEPFGIVALEAMAAGRPVVVADVGGLREIVPGDGTVGARVPAEDPAALRAVVRELLGDPAVGERMGRAGRARAAGRGWPSVARATGEVYAGHLAAAL